MWRRLNFMELGKDVILLPYYLGRALGYHTEICCGYADELRIQVCQAEKENLKFVRCNLTYNSYQRILVYLKYLFQNSSRIDLLMCFHWRLETFVAILWYSFLNKKGRIYIKLDTSAGIEWDLSYRNCISRIVRKLLYNRCLKKVNLFSCETSLAYKNLCSNKDFGELLKTKLVMMPNSFDEPLFKELGIKEKYYPQKENLMITVGRLGTHQKNTEMLLDALADVNLNGWTFYFIGPVEKSFQNVIDDFFSQHPEKRKCVKFVGPLYDKKKLWEYYNRSRVFVLTSRWEGSPLIFPEAKRFRNYIVSTNVGGAEDVMEKGKYGILVNQEDVPQLENILVQIVNNERDIDVYQNYDVQDLSYRNHVEILANFLR